MGHHHERTWVDLPKVLEDVVPGKGDQRFLSPNRSAMSFASWRSLQIAAIRLPRSWVDGSFISASRAAIALLTVVVNDRS
jgi:hypothetical protein